MELNDFLSKFKEQFVDADEIILTAEDDFRQIDSYDSLTGMAILVMIKDEFDVDLTDEEYKALPSVKAIFEYIKSKL